MLFVKYNQNNQDKNEMGKASSMGEKRTVYKFSFGKPEGQRPLERLRYRWEDNVKMDLREIEWGDVD
jgi:hypothetical protein